MEWNNNEIYACFQTRLDACVKTMHAPKWILVYVRKCRRAAGCTLQ